MRHTIENGLCFLNTPIPSKFCDLRVAVDEKLTAFLGSSRVKTFPILKILGRKIEGMKLEIVRGKLFEDKGDG